MKKICIVLGYLFWGLAFFPAAVLVAAVIGLPYFAAVYWLHWVNGWSGIIGFLLYSLLFVLLIGLRFEFWFDLAICEAIDFFIRTLYDAALISCVFFLIGCFGTFLNAGIRTFLLWLGIPLAAVSLIWLPFFFSEAWGECRMRFKELRAEAVKKLPYPEERETLVQTALHDQEASVRCAALEKLPYPEERETLVQAALQDQAPFARLIALEKLPYPEEQETLVEASLLDRKLTNRAAALKKLRDPEEREIIEKAEAALIEFCEDIIRAEEENPNETADVRFAISTLKELYQKYCIPKCVKRNTYHTDYTEYDVVWEDYADGCSGTFSEDVHTDFTEERGYRIVEESQ